jgi:hypothetical protein
MKNHRHAPTLSTKAVNHIIAFILLATIAALISCSNNSTPVEADTEAPAVVITNPLDDQYVDDIVTIRAVASDNDRVIRVEFWVDDHLEYQDNHLPWEFAWNTTAYLDSSQHSIYARAYDAAFNTCSSSKIYVTVLNPQPDTLPPGKIYDLEVTDSSQTSLTLSWTSPGNDGCIGVAWRYSLKYYQSEITEQNWDSANGVADPPLPQEYGETESFEVTDLSAGTTYYFAIKAYDEEFNWAELSNNAMGTTLSDSSEAISGTCYIGPKKR